MEPGLCRCHLLGVTCEASSQAPSRPQMDAPCSCAGRCQDEVAGQVVLGQRLTGGRGSSIWARWSLAQGCQATKTHVFKSASRSGAFRCISSGILRQFKCQRQRRVFDMESSKIQSQTSVNTSRPKDAPTQTGSKLAGLTKSAHKQILFQGSYPGPSPCR